MATIYYIPAASEDAARAVVYGIEAGRIPALPEYLDPEKAAENFDTYPRGMGYRLWAVERRAVDDGRIANVRPFEKLGEIAAALMIVIGTSYLTGWASIL